MKRSTLFILLFLTSQFVRGQACGIYRIEYTGSITSQNKEIVKVYLPTTMFLHGVEKASSNMAFADTTVTNGIFDLQIYSHLTTPYNNITSLLSFYKKRSDRFKMKISFLENGSLKEKIIKIEWDDIEVSIIEDGEFGTLFKFKIRDITI